MSRPSTDFAACFIEATIIGPESINVPSRSKRTTGKRIRVIVVTQSVLDADEVQTVRRRRLAGLAAFVAIQEAREVLRIGPLDHRPDERAHHVAQERVGGDLEVEMVAALDPGRRPDDANEDLVLRLRRRERAEVVLA